MGLVKLEKEMRRLGKSRLYWSKILGELKLKELRDQADIRMTGANMNLVTVNVKLGENDPEPEQKLEPVRFSMRRSRMLMSRENIS
jgi:hypothetical protein